MTQSDWITIAASGTATVLAAVVSWILFRLQQTADIRNLAERIDSMSQQLGQHVELTQHVDTAVNLATVRETITNMDRQLIKTIDAIDDGFAAQKASLENALKARVATHLTKAKKEFEASLKSELQRIIPESDTRQQVTEEIIEVFVEHTSGLSDIDTENDGAPAQTSVKFNLKGTFSGVQDLLSQLRGVAGMPKLIEGPVEQAAENG